MNLREIAQKVLNGYLILVGEVMSADVRESGEVDKNTGLKNTVWVITYFVALRRPGDFTVAKVRRWLPDTGIDPSSVPLGAEQGRCYAFEVVRTERKNGFLEANMAKTEPALLMPEGAALPADAPQGAATGSAPNLV